jgi:hypothetical protein
VVKIITCPQEEGKRVQKRRKEEKEEGKIMPNPVDRFENYLGH